MRPVKDGSIRSLSAFQVTACPKVGDRVQDCAYLGNMCVDEPFRRRGYGKVLLRAGEKLTRLASFPAIFLHLRSVTFSTPV